MLEHHGHGASYNLSQEHATQTEAEPHWWAPSNHLQDYQNHVLSTGSNGVQH